MGSFADALRLAGVLDHRAVQLPGAIVALPHGVRIFGRFASIVREAYHDAGIEEFDFPFVVPASSFEPLSKVLPLAGRLLHCVTDEELRSSRSRAALGPSGEAVVYDYLRRTVRGPETLPIRIFRQARYFRPAPPGKHSGRGIFRALEAGDVFEFHCAYATVAEKDRELAIQLKVLRQIAATCAVPMIFGVRPPWTNRAEVSVSTIGGDVLLPVGATVQAACLYDQDQTFSRVFDIRVRGPGAGGFTHQTAGAITRRLALCHLFLGLRQSGALSLHPALAPAEVVVLSTAARERDGAPAGALVAALRAAGARADARVLPEGARPGAVRGEILRGGAPIVATLQGPRWPGDPPRTVIARSDTRAEAALPDAGPAETAALLQHVVADIGAAFRRRAERFLASRCREATASTARELMETRHVAVCPLAATEAVVREVTRWGSGEVLGYAASEEVRPCILSGERVRTVAFLSRRV